MAFRKSGTKGTCFGDDDGSSGDNGDDKWGGAVTEKRLFNPVLHQLCDFYPLLLLPRLETTQNTYLECQSRGQPRSWSLLLNPYLEACYELSCQTSPFSVALGLPHFLIYPVFFSTWWAACLLQEEWESGISGTTNTLFRGQWVISAHVIASHPTLTASLTSGHGGERRSRHSGRMLAVFSLPDSSHRLHHITCQVLWAEQTSRYPGADCTSPCLSLWGPRVTWCWGEPRASHGFPVERAEDGSTLSLQRVLIDKKSI